MRAMILCVALVLSACGGSQDITQTGQQKENYFFSVENAAASDMERIQSFSKEFCSKKSFCILGFWEKGVAAPKSLPLTEYETKHQIASYRMNRHTGHEAILWRCDRYPQSRSGSCFID